MGHSVGLQVRALVSFRAMFPVFPAIAGSGSSIDFVFHAEIIAVTLIIQGYHVDEEIRFIASEVVVKVCVNVY